MPKPKALMTPDELKRSRDLSKAWNRANPERVRASAQRRIARAKSDPILRKKLNEAAARARYKRVYGLTFEQRDEILAAQGNKCFLCDKPNPNQTDHSHRTGKFRAMLCVKCNLFVGLIEESEDRHQRALAYIETHK